MKGNGVYCVNVLPEERADLARAFSGQLDGTRSDRFEGVPVTEHDGNAPGIVGAAT
ncbi:MAG: flavin reductase, partial [Pseudomonadota bacterium]